MRLREDGCPRAVSGGTGGTSRFQRLAVEFDANFAAETAADGHF